MNALDRSVKLTVKVHPEADIFQKHPKEVHSYADSFANAALLDGQVGFEVPANTHKCVLPFGRSIGPTTWRIETVTGVRINHQFKVVSQNCVLETLARRCRRHSVRLADQNEQRGI